MGLFSRNKSSKSSQHEPEAISKDSSSTRGSVPSMKSGGMASTPVNIPEVAIARPPDPTLDSAGYLRSINAVRERSRQVFRKAKSNQLNHFDVDWAKFKDTATYVVSIIKRDYAPDYKSIPPHGRWQHFEVGGRPRIDQLLTSWPSSVDAQERTRRLIDLFLVSVLLDAGSGRSWEYKSKESGRIYRRSEGLAVASLEMFKTGLFSSHSSEPCQVDGAALSRLTVDQLAKGLQVSERNPITGLEGRTGLLQRLGAALNNQELFGVDARPGNMLDYLLAHPSTQASSVPIIPLPTLWSVLIDGLSSIWPASRTQIDGTPLGDAWPCTSMPRSPPAAPWENIVPFHKLTQWLCYSLMTPMSKLLNIHFAGRELLTGLPEYRNGGLFIDTGLLTLKPDDMKRGIENFKKNSQSGKPSIEVVPLFNTDDDVIVEWRALTVSLLDELLPEVNRLLGLKGKESLSLAQLLEAGTWKAST
ncbi:MAG: hypothetical protein M1834_004461 [Cirrosporium novae-zelandiae]|nr:MAG: hypothetical protein M1834_004461 [Cirrosporium novae-zelandiae]